jgi:hypothetical protein
MVRWLLALVVALSIAACGGGGDGGGDQPQQATTCTWDVSAWDNCTWGN